jgi:hypothetical protein
MEIKKVPKTIVMKTMAKKKKKEEVTMKIVMKMMKAQEPKKMNIQIWKNLKMIRRNPQRSPRKSKK